MSSRARRRGRAQVARVGVLLAGAVLLVAVAACGSSGPSGAPAGGTAAGSPGVRAYISCLMQHLDGASTPAGATGGSAGAGPRRACVSLRPPGGLSAAAQSFAGCLKAHGVTPPSLPPVARGADIVSFIGHLKDGSASQRSALSSCLGPATAG